MSQVIKKRNIVLASVLKPVDDTRMFEKMGQSLAATGEYEVHIIGYPGSRNYAFPGVHFYPSKTFGRLSAYRLLVPFVSFFKAIKLNPSLVIITTHELLAFAWLLKMVKGCKIVYDVQENYLRNILFLSTFPILLRPLLALYVRVKEILHTPFISLFILSDEGYRQELTFMKSKCTVVENKVKKSLIPERSKPDYKTTIQLLFSGTLADSTGVFTAIELAKQLHAINNKVCLNVIGYCAKPNVLRNIRSAIEDSAFIRLTGGDHLVPHDKILEAIGRADFGIIAYSPNPSTQNTMPTKLYEYLGSQLPILLINYDFWVDQCSRFPAAIPFDPKSYKPSEVLAKMLSSVFYTTVPGPEIYWEGEAKKLITSLKSV